MPELDMSVDCLWFKSNCLRIVNNDNNKYKVSILLYFLLFTFPPSICPPAVASTAAIPAVLFLLAEAVELEL